MAKTASKKKVQFWGTGRRKKSIARVRLIPGGGKITINKRDIDEYFGLDTLKYIVRTTWKSTCAAAATRDRQALSVTVFPVRW